jgi:hypothetical protein
MRPQVFKAWVELDDNRGISAHVLVACLNGRKWQ